MNLDERTRCPDPGALRAWLDHEDKTPSFEDHLASCPGCQRVIAELRDDADDVHEILSVLAPTRVPDATEIAVARERLEWRRAAAPRSPHPKHARRLEPLPMFVSRVSTPWRVAASGVAAAVLVGLLVAFTPEGGAVAASILAPFRSQQVTAIGVTPQSQADVMKTLNALGNLGTISGAGSSGGVAKPEAVARSAEGQVRTVTLAQATQAVGFPLLTPDPATLPSGVSATPQVRVTPQTQLRFTFNKAKAASYFQSTGHPEVSLPDKFDGATLAVTIPAAAIIEYGNPQSRTGLMVAEAGEVVADVQGNVSLPEMRDFLLSLPGLPPTVVSQLKQIQSWNDTLPIPVPVDQVHWDSVTIKGNKGLLLNDNSGVGSAAIWHANGHLYGLGGSLKATDLKRIADSMAVH